MKQLVRNALTAVVLSAAISSLALAQTKDEHAGHHPEGQTPGAAAPATAPTAPAAASSEVSPVEGGMKRLQELMTRIESTTDGAERENLMHEHMLALLQEVKLLRTQTSGMKMAMMAGKQGGAMGGMDAGKNQTAKPNARDKKGAMMGAGMMSESMMSAGMMGMHKMMEQRLDTIEQLLEQAIKHAHQREAAQH
jgi:hypothetical protein